LTNKRALVVDDSRSARISLQKMLEKYGIAVDFAESGEEALDYLKHHLVDAIFMDHTMPGMDGLETVVAIKSNPRTATIPVMMYTAREGEVYVSQARALGAIGVLPKQVQPGVLQEMLRKLGLLREGVAEDATAGAMVSAANEPPPVPAAPPSAAPPVPPAAVAPRQAERSPERYAEDPADAQYDQQALGASVQALITRVLNEQHVRLRSDVLSAHRDFARQVAAEILAKERPATSEAPAEAGAPVVPQAPSARSRSVSVAWLLLLPLLALGALYWQTRDERDAYAAGMGRLQSALEQGEAELAALRAARVNDEDAERQLANGRYLDLVHAVEWALNQDSRVGFDEPAFDDRRATELETLLGDLVDAGFRGTVRLESHLGEFCLVNDPDGGYRLAPPGAVLDECSRMGHPLDESTSIEERQSAGFASFVASSPLLDDTGIRVELVALDREGSDPVEPVPATVTTAGDWNEAARRNHRVSYTISPDTSM
jgi:CheY-like chemotaxis protein